MKRNSLTYAALAAGLLMCLLLVPWTNAEITPPEPNVEPGSETPTNTALSVEITSFTMDLTTTETTYDYTINALGTGSDDIVQGYYSIWVYGSGQGESGAQENWEASPIDEEHEYGVHQYKEEFFGTGPEGSWSTWKWTFHSQGPIDDNNRARFEDPESFWGPIDHMLLWIRGYAEDGTWDQDSHDITKEYTGIDPGSGDDDTTDDDTTDDDTTDDDTTDDDTTDDDTSDDDDDSPGFGVVMAVSALVISAVFIIRRKRN